MVRRWLSAALAIACAGSVRAAPDGQQTLFNFVRPADVVQVTTQDASLPQANAEQTAEGEVLRRVTFNPVTRPSLRLSPQSGVWDWSGESAMTLRVQSAMDWALTLYVQVQSSDGKTLNSQIDLPAGPAQTLIVPLKASSALSEGMRIGPPMPWTYEGQRVLLANTNGELNASQVTSVTVSMSQPQVAQSVLIEKFGVQEDDMIQKAAYSNLLDGYGQYTRGKWPEKITRDDQLKSLASQEQQQLKAWLKDRPAHDKYGGLLKGPVFEAKGFFRAEKRNDRWYLVTPEGHPFYSLGINAIAADDSQTYVEGRESMFASLATTIRWQRFTAPMMTTATPVPTRIGSSIRGAGSISTAPICNALMVCPSASRFSDLHLWSTKMKTPKPRSPTPLTIRRILRLRLKNPPRHNPPWNANR